jgi:hypothetical protein
MRIPIWTAVILLVFVFFTKGIANFASPQTLRFHATFHHDQSDDHGHHYGHDEGEDDDPNDDGIDDHDDDHDDVQSDDHDGRLVHIGRDLTDWAGTLLRAK